jgi:hypothetical protein
MANSEHFIVSSKTKKISRSKDNSRYYWEGKGKGTIDMEIEVFGYYNQEEHAKKIYEALKNAGLENSYFKIKVEVK